MDGENPLKSPRQAATSPPGELILQNGRQAGAHRPLGMPSTFIGRHAGCEIRLNVDGIEPMHCVLIAGPDGVQLRDLGSKHGTSVNGNRVETAWLRHGDMLKVGPFVFRVDLPAPAADLAAPAPDETAEQIREALRIQAAAIAAQQVALEEEESRLQQRRLDLEQQEEQLAAHLAEKQRQVQIWSDFTQSERETLHKERLAHEKQMAAQATELLQARQELGQTQQKIRTEQQRIKKVHQRLRERWQQQNEAEKEKREHLTRKLQADEQRLEESLALVAARESAHVQRVIEFNTQRELFVRQKRDEQVRLTAQRQAWRRRRSLEYRVLRTKELAIAEAQDKLQQAWELLRAEKAQWDQQQGALQKELHGLNNRIVHQRLRLQELEEHCARLNANLHVRQAETGAAAPVECEVEVLGETAPAWQQRVDDLDRLAGELADQRALLTEQFGRLVQVHAAWQELRDAAAADLDRLAQRLVAEEDTLSQRDRQTILIEQALQERQAEIDAARHDLHVWRAQCKSQEATFAQEHDIRMASLRHKEAMLQQQLADLASLRQRWNLRRQQEIQEQRTTRTLLEQQRKDTLQLRAEFAAKGLQLEHERRTLAEKALALEQYRQEVFFRANDPAAQRRVERMRRRWLSLNAALVRTAKSERDAAKRELAQLEAQRAELIKRSEETTAAVADLAEKQELLEEREIALATHEQRLAQTRQQSEMERSVAPSGEDQIEILAQVTYQDAA